MLRDEQLKELAKFKSQLEYTEVVKETKTNTLFEKSEKRPEDIISRENIDPFDTLKIPQQEFDDVIGRKAEKRKYKVVICKGIRSVRNAKLKFHNYFSDSDLLSTKFLGEIKSVNNSIIREEELPIGVGYDSLDFSNERIEGILSSAGIMDKYLYKGSYLEKKFDIVSTKNPIRVYYYRKDTDDDDTKELTIKFIDLHHLLATTIDLEIEINYRKTVDYRRCIGVFLHND